MSYWHQPSRLKQLLRLLLSIAALLCFAFVVMDNQTTWAAPVERPRNQTVPPPTYLPVISSPLINSCNSFQYACNLTYRTGESNGSHAWAPDGNTLVFYRERGVEATGLYSMTATGQQLTLLVELEEIIEISYSPNGEQIAFVATRASSPINDLYVYTVASHEVRMLSNPAQSNTSDGSPAWSPDSSTVVFVRLLHSVGVTDIYTFRPDGSDLTQLTNTEAGDSQPSYSPDGSRIVYVVEEGPNPTIYLMEADGSEPTNLTGSVAPYTDNPSWANDNSIIFFGTTGPSDWDLYKIQADGSNAEMLTEDALLQGNPIASPDGSRILYLVQRGPEVAEVDFYTMNFDGSGVTKFINPSGKGDSVFHIQWHPSGALFSYAATTDLTNIYLLRAEP